MSESRSDSSPKDQTTNDLENFLLFLASHRRGIIVLGLAIALGIFIIVLPRQVLTSILTGLLAQHTIVVLSLVFSLITVSLLFSAGQRWDAWAFLFFNRRTYHSRWLDVIMWLATQLGNGLLAIIGAGLLYFFKYRRLAILMVLGILSLWLLVELIKALADRARPFHLLTETRVVGWRARGRSFPSGHTSQIFFLASLFIHHFQLGIAWSLLLYGVAALVGFTRVYVGVHYPRDVLAGSVLGTAWGILGVLVDSYFSNRFA